MNTRSLSAEVLEQVTVGGRPLTDALNQILPSIPREDDRAFVQSLCYGVARWYFRLDFILRQLAAKPIRDEKVRLLAMLGLYQLEYTRVKPHAAVAETVSAAGRKTWAKPLLNGILRNYQRQRDQVLDRLQAEESGNYSHPAWLIGEIRKCWPTEWTTILEMSNRQPPMTLRVNRRLGTRDDYLRLLEQSGMAARPCQFAAFGVVLENPVDVGRLPRFSEGGVSVQDEAAQLASALLLLEPGLRVLDVCAAPGGKTLDILETQPLLEGVTAVDVDPARAERIGENLDRAGLAANVVCADATNPSPWWDGKPFDRILLDAPCSATGVIRRRPDIKLLRRPADMAHLKRLQRSLLEGVWPLLRKGGLLVYATCSILKDENEIQTSNFLLDHPEAREVLIDADWGRPAGVGRQILSGEHGMDGFYYARLAK